MTTFLNLRQVSIIMRQVSVIKWQVFICIWQVPVCIWQEIVFLWQVFIILWQVCVFLRQVFVCIWQVFVYIVENVIFIFRKPTAKEKRSIRTLRKQICASALFVNRVISYKLSVNYGFSPVNSLYFLKSASASAILFVNL